MAVLDGSALRKLYLDHSRPTCQLDGEHGERIVAKLCEVLKVFLQAKARHVVEQAQGRAILFSYGSDATPLLTLTTVNSQHGASRFQRRAHKAEELLI